MSKSALETEVDQLQANGAFLSDFLNVPLFDLTQERPVAVATLARTAEQNKLAQVQAQVDKIAPQPPVSSTPVTSLPAAPKVVMTKPIAGIPPRKNYGGKYVIWTPNQPLPEERILIKKIIEAVGIPAASLVLETATTTEHADWSTTPFVFAFGIQFVPGGLHTVNSWQGTQLLKTVTLSALNTDLNQKKVLWAVLKQAFKL